VPSESDYENNIELVAAALRATVPKREQFERVGAQDHVRITNVVQFTLLWNGDLSIQLYELQRLAPSPSLANRWRRTLAGRLLALTIVEASDELIGLLGRDLRNAVGRVGTPQDLVRIGALHKELNAFAKSHCPGLRKVRNTVLGHRDPDAGVQIESLESIAVGDIEQHGWTLLSWNTRLMDSLSDVMTRSSRR
jgi:hypothetical protein